MKKYVVACIETPRQGDWQIGFVELPILNRRPWLEPHFSSDARPAMMDRQTAQNVFAQVPRRPGLIWFLHEAGRYQRRSLPVTVRTKMNSARRAAFNHAVAEVAASSAPPLIDVDIWAPL